MENENSNIVIDTGEYSIKAGFAGEADPRVIFPTLSGKPKANSLMGGGGSGSYYGDEAKSKQGTLSLTNPIQGGSITNWEDMERLWSYTFTSQLNTSSEDANVLLTGTPYGSKNDIEKMATFMFESLEVSNLYFASQEVLALYASGKTTGTVINSGEGITSVMPIYEGAPITGAGCRIQLAGKDITDYLKVLLKEKGHDYKTPIEMDIVRDIKEKLWFTVSKDYEKALDESSGNASMEKSYELPDETTISVGNERFRCPELLFNPRLAKLDMEGIHLHSYTSIMKCDKDSHRDLFSNIVLAGGSTLFKDMEKRIQYDLEKLLAEDNHSEYKVHITHPDKRGIAAWIGGSTLGGLTTFQSWISKGKYDEEGPKAILYKGL